MFFFFQAEDGIRDHCVTGVQTCALPIYWGVPVAPANPVSEERLTQSANASVRSHHDFFSSLRKIFGVRLPLSWGAAALIVLVSVMIGLSSRRFARSVPASGIQVFLREKGRQA